jgi:hypothetical protein
LRRGLLTSVLAPVVGLERVFHLDQMDDRGFALLTGGRSCPSRHPVGGWRRHLRWYEVDAFCRRTCPWDLIRGDDAQVSFDEHTIPRWTHKFCALYGKLARLAAEMGAGIRVAPPPRCCRVG